MLQAFHIFQLNIFLIFNRRYFLSSLITPTAAFHLPELFVCGFQDCCRCRWVISRAREFSAQWPTRFPWQGHGETQVERALFTLKIQKIQRRSGVRTPSSSQWAERIHSLDLQLKHLYASPFPPKGGCIEGKKPSNINEPKLFNSGTHHCVSLLIFFKYFSQGFLENSEKN